MSGHISVLLPESIAYLDVQDGGTYVDLTLGRGGTSSAILKKIPHGRLYSFDLDEEAIESSKERLDAIGSNYELIHANFKAFKQELLARGVTQLNGLTADLGVSSPQFDEGERGFSYKEEAPLDMRMDLRNTLTAERIVNTYSEKDLIRIFARYGEDPDSARVAKAIVRERINRPIITTTELVELIKKAKPITSLLKKGHPAKQIFQALRIEVNGELDNLQQALEDFDSMMAPGGRVAFISFQSLEDRLVKEKFRSLCVVEGDRHAPAIRPEEVQQASYLLLTKKPVEPDEKEKENNHRATNAKLRAIQKKEIRP